MGKAWLTRGARRVYRLGSFLEASFAALPSKVKAQDDTVGREVCFLILTNPEHICIVYPSSNESHLRVLVQSWKDVFPCP